MPSSTTVTTSSVQQLSQSFISPTKRTLNRAGPPSAEATTTRNDLWRWCLRADSVAPCYIRDIMALREDKSRDQDTFWWLGTVPCRSVQFVGILVAAVAYERRTIYTVDDGTGVIQCLHLRSAANREKDKHDTHRHEFPKPSYDIGDILRVAGRVEKWHETFRVVINDIELCKPNDEPEHWIATAQLHETYYSQPFIIPSLPPSPPPKTPVKPVSSRCTTPSTASIVPTPSSAGSSRTKADNRIRLRHPSRLRSKELISTTFKIYVKNYMDELSDPSPLHTGMESPTERSKRPHASIDELECVTPTPKRPRLGEGEVTPRPYNVSRPRQYVPKGITLPHLRRVPLLADMALRVVRAETKRRTRLKAQEARTKTNSQPPAPEPAPEPTGRKVKRLYTWTIRELYREGSIILTEDDAPVWGLPLSDGEETRDVGDGNVSDPASHEEAYIPLTSAVLAEPIISGIRGMMMRRGRGGGPPTAEELRAYLAAMDARWENVTEYAVEDGLEALREKGKVYRVGKGRWEVSL